MTNEFDALYETFHTVLDLSESARRLEQFGLNPADIERLRARHDRQTAPITNLARGHALSLHQQDVWYTGPNDHTDRYWPALFSHLQQQGWAQQPALSSLDAASTHVMARLNHPKQPSFSTRGLVISYPQSGKTTNAAAVIAKAADRGYRLFIVLTGIHNALRRQVQQRLTQLLVEPHPTPWWELTSPEEDFNPPPVNPAVFFNTTGRPVLCVVKKNAAVLRKLRHWLATASPVLHDCPALVIDTEAEQATVASKTVAPLIRDMMGSLSRCAYLGYADSPVTSVLLNPRDEELYPRDFVVTLPAPAGHVGADVLFGRDALDSDDPGQTDDGYDMIRLIPEVELPLLRPTARVAVENFRPAIPSTLRQAIEYFWMVAAARRVRNIGTPHNAMLIHTSVRNSVHASFMAPLQALRKQCAHALSSASYRAQLHELWRQEVSRVPVEDFDQATISFDDLMPHLPQVVADCRIIVDNSTSEDPLDYSSQPITTIVVGGNTLSQGRALEGLSVGYFVRSTSAYDTLQQMQRWVGVRAGYGDMPRIWLTHELTALWRQVASVESELRHQLDTAVSEGATPLELGLRMRTHPAVRALTTTTQSDPIPTVSSYGGRRVQTHYFHTNADWLRANLHAARTLIAEATSHATEIQDRPDLGRYLFLSVPSDLIIDFLSRYQFHEKALENNPNLLINYIRKRIARTGSLQSWNIAILGKPSETGDDTLTFADGITVGRIIRSRLSYPSPETDFADIKTLMSPRDAAIDLAGDPSRLSESDMRHARKTQLPDTGLLAVYPIDKISAPSSAKTLRAPLNAEEHVIGIGLVFPEPDTADSTV